MKALKREAVEQMITYADAHELDNLVGEMVSLPPNALAELKALAWLAKDADSPKHWEALVIEAKFQLDDQTARFIATMPGLADNLRKGLDMLEASGRL